MTTLAEIEVIPKPVLTASDIAGYLGVDAQLIRLQARKDPKMLGFPVVVIASRTKIPKEGFIAWCKGEYHEPRN